MATSLITNKSIRQSEYIDTRTVRIPRDTIERRDMGALFMCQDKRVPFGRQLTFDNAEDVCKHFGVNSEQYKIALQYFAYTEENCEKQTHISFGRWTRGSQVETFTTMLTRMHRHKVTDGAYSIVEVDIKRDARKTLLEPMEWFEVGNVARNISGFCAWFDENFNQGREDADKYRGIVTIETRNEETPQVYYAPSADKTKWEYVDKLTSKDKTTFVIYMEDACKREVSGTTTVSADLTKYGEGELLKCFISETITLEDGTTKNVNVSTWFAYDKYYDRFLRKTSVEPVFEVVGHNTTEELFTKTESNSDGTTSDVSIQSDFRQGLIHNGACYRIYSNVGNGAEYTYYTWDRRLKKWNKDGVNGRLNYYDYSFSTEEDMRKKMENDVRVINDANTVLETVDGANLLTYYKRYSKTERAFVDACERLKDGVTNLQSSILFKPSVVGELSDLDPTSYEQGDIVPLVSPVDFKTRFYKLVNESFSLILIDGKTEHVIVDNYPYASYKVNDSIENFPSSSEPSDKDYCLVRDVIGKTLHSSYYRYSEDEEKWNAVTGMQNVDVPSNYPNSTNYTASGIKKISAEGEPEDYEPIFDTEITDIEDGEFVTYVEYNALDFIRYYFVYDQLKGKFVYVRKSSDFATYPSTSYDVDSLAELLAIDMSSYKVEDTKYVVAKVVDKDDFYTTYYCYSVAEKVWGVRGEARDVINNYPVRGNITSVQDPHDINQLNKIVTDNQLFACVNPTYYTDYGEGYYVWYFSLAEWKTLYSNSIRETDVNYSGEKTGTKDIEEIEKAVQRHGYPNLDGVYHDTDTDKYYMWMERISPQYDTLTSGFVELVVKEDKNGDGKFFTDKKSFIDIESLFDVDIPVTVNDLTTMYVNDYTGSRYVYLSNEWRKIVSTKTAKDTVSIKRLVGEDITSDVAEFRTNYNGVLLTIVTNQTRLMPISFANKGSVETYEKLLAISANVGDYYTVTSSSSRYAWNGVKWFLRTDSTADNTVTYITSDLYYTIPISCRDEIDSFESLAALIQRHVRLQRGLESVSVCAVRSYGKYHIEIEFEDSIGILAVTSNDADSAYSNKLGFRNTTTQTVSTYPKEYPVEAIQRVASTCNNFGSFSFMDVPQYDLSVSGGANIVGYETALTKDDIDAICAWNKAENFTFLYVQGFKENDSNEANGDPFPYDSLPNEGHGLGNVMVVRGGDGHDYEELIPMSIFAATSYEEPESVKGFMFKRFKTGAFTPTVGYTKQSFAEMGKAEQWAEQNAEKERMAKFDALNLNYIVRTQEFGLQKRDYFQRGKCYDGMDISTYCSEVWLKDAFSTALLKLLMQYEKLTPTISSLNLASAVMIPVVTEAEENGMIVVPEEALPNATRIYIDQQTGVEESYKEIEKDGYLLQFDFADDEKNGGKAIFYRFMYCKNGDIRKIEGYQAYKA